MKFYHGSSIELKNGLILKGRGKQYEESWGNTDFYFVLESFRPEHCISHKDAVFLCHSPDDVDLAGGGTEYLCEMKIIGEVQKHDLNWGAEISSIMCDEPDNIEEIERCANSYWNGLPYDKGESIWEYCTTSAQVLNCKNFNDFDDYEVTEYNQADFDNFLTQHNAQKKSKLKI